MGLTTTNSSSGSSRPGYPTYEEIEDARVRRKRQELEGGRQRVLKTMAEGLIERIAKDYNIKGNVILDSSHPDPRNWTVTIEQEMISTEENFWGFPSDELTTKMMLLGMVT